MKVVATKPGYFGKLRAPGEEFDVPKDSKASWFTPVSEKKAESDKSDKSDKDGKSDKGGKKAESGDSPA